MGSSLCLLSYSRMCTARLHRGESRHAHEQSRQSPVRHRLLIQRHAAFFFEFSCVAECSDFVKGCRLGASSGRRRMRAQPQRGPENNFIDTDAEALTRKLAALRGLHGSAQVARVHGYRDGAFLARKRRARSGIAGPSTRPVWSCRSGNCARRERFARPLKREIPHGVAKNSITIRRVVLSRVCRWAQRVKHI